MGAAKRMMMELEEYNWEETSVCFQCPNPECGKVSDGSADVPVLYPGDASDVLLPVDLQCIWCDEHFRAEIRVDRSGDLKITIDEAPDVDVDFEPLFCPEHDDELWAIENHYFERPEKPHDIFLASYADIVGFIDGIKGNLGTHPMNRMVFMQCFSVFEAYLCDRYLNLVFLCDKTMLMFVENHKQLKSTTLSILSLFEQKGKKVEDLIEMQITKSIKDTLFHNFSKAVTLFGIYEAALFASKDHKDLLFDAAQLRHHCVHRNGRDKDGNELANFTPEYIETVAKAMKETAASLEVAISKCEDKILPF